jgi:hypothetical protein
MISVLALVMVSASDSARVVDNRIVVEPAGVSVAIPASWSDESRLRRGHCFIGKLPAIYAPLSPTRDELTGVHSTWHRVFSAVADSVLPLSDVAAHFGRLDWRNPPCYAELQARIYVTQLDVDSIVKRAQSIGVATADRFFRATAAVTDTSGWRRIRITWYASYGDVGGPVTMDYYVRANRGRTAVLLLMYVGNSFLRPEEDAAAVLASWRQ